jgi:uncharacterized membrane protein
MANINLNFSGNPISFQRTDFSLLRCLFSVQLKYFCPLTERISSPRGFNRFHAVYKLLIATAFSLVIFFLILDKPMEKITRIMISWDVFSFCLIVMSGINFFSMKPQEIRYQAKNQDTSKSVVLVIILISTVGSLLGIFLIIMNKGTWMLNKYTETFIYIFGVNCSWFLLHIMFTFRYAHLYYGDHPSTRGVDMAGLDIPEEDFPDYLDFAYFSFVIGMTFQVSDIRIISRSIRRLALLHGLLAFLFNTVIVAMVINVILDLKT